MKYLIMKFKTWFIWLFIMVSILLSPFIGRGIDNTTRALISGLSTDKQLEVVSDIIDENKVTSEEKILELNNIIESQRIEIKNNQEDIEKQKKLINEAAKAIDDTNKAIVIQKEKTDKNNNCNVDVSKYCNLRQYREISEYNDFKESTMKSCVNSGESSKSCSEIFKDRYEPNFDKCQEALSCN